MNKVLIALDYDPSAQKVAETGFLLVKSMGFEITLLHVIADTTYYSALEYAPVEGAMDFSQIEISHLLRPDGLKKATKHFLEKVKKHLGDETIQTVVKEGEFSETILKEAKNLKVDFIIMGSHSRKWLENIIMGSVTEKVLRHTTIPLFIIPTKKTI